MDAAASCIARHVLNGYLHAILEAAASTVVAEDRHVIQLGDIAAPIADSKVESQVNLLARALPFRRLAKQLLHQHHVTIIPCFSLFFFGRLSSIFSIFYYVLSSLDKACGRLEVESNVCGGFVHLSDLCVVNSRL